MPNPSLALAGIQAGSQLAGGMTDASFQEYNNRASRRWSERMYKKQYDDGVAFWNMQNTYNSPQAQMQRFQAAGLNPNLIYGQGNSGNAGSIPVPDVQSAQFRSPEFGGAFSSAGLALSNFYDFEIKQAQLDNMKLQADVITEDANLRRAQTLSTVTNAERSRFDLDLESELRPISLDARRERLRQTRSTTDIAIQENARRAALSSNSLQESAQRMLNMQEQRLNMRQQRTQSQAEVQRINQSVRNMISDGTLKQLDIDLRKQGINPNDPMWSRLVGRILTDIFESSETPSLLDFFR